MCIAPGPRENDSTATNAWPSPQEPGMYFILAPREGGGATAIVCSSPRERGMRIAPDPREDGVIGATVCSSLREPEMRIAPGLREDGFIAGTHAFHRQGRVCVPLPVVPATDDRIASSTCSSTREPGRRNAPGLREDCAIAYPVYSPPRTGYASRSQPSRRRWYCCHRMLTPARTGNAYLAWSSRRPLVFCSYRLITAGIRYEHPATTVAWLRP